MLEDSYGAVMVRIGEDLKRRLVSFDAEDGSDYSGVSRYVLFPCVFITRVLTAASQEIVFNPPTIFLDTQRTTTTLSR